MKITLLAQTRPPQVKMVRPMAALAWPNTGWGKSGTVSEQEEGRVRTLAVIMSALPRLPDGVSPPRTTMAGWSPGKINPISPTI